MALQCPNHLANGRIPKPDGSALASRGYSATVWAESNGADVARVSKRVEQSAFRHIPQLDGLVLAARGKPSPVGAEGDRQDKLALVLERAQQSANGWIP